jgi:hypothetical protein
MDNSFRTSVQVRAFPFAVDYNTPVLFVGSCFAENIGSMMFEKKFPVRINPFGVLYNPVSVAMVLKRMVDGSPFAEDELTPHRNVWLSFQHDTSFSAESKEECLFGINKSLTDANNFWGKTEVLVVTFGTARVYYHNKQGLPVANCHKIAAKEFTNRLLSVDEIIGTWTDLLNELFKGKDVLKIILSVSPIRHWKDGPLGNQISKATLILAASQLVDKFPEKVFYFPSYEIMMDDLRDYRFYADDMLHPSDIAINYIWEKFKNSLIPNESQLLMNEIERIVQAVKHRPMKTNTIDFKEFINSTLQKIDQIVKRNTGIDFTEEVDALKQYNQ